MPEEDVPVVIPWQTIGEDELMRTETDEQGAEEYVGEKQKKSRNNHSSGSLSIPRGLAWNEDEFPGIIGYAPSRCK